jgi:uncharacterized protein (TIGR00730 family)
MKNGETPTKAYKNLEFLNSREARTIRILSEYIEPLTRLEKHKVNNWVLFFGSARVNPEDKDSPLYKYYWEAEEIAYELARWAIQLKPKGKNFVICTGGGPGIMEAANRGAHRAGGKSIGMNISLPHEQKLNPYVSPEISFTFHYFFMRKFWLVYKAKAIVAFPGGFGTLDEVFELLTLVQTKKINRKGTMICLYGEEYWKKIINFEALLDYGAIDKEDFKLIHYVSNPEDACAFLKENLKEFMN